MSSTSCHTSSSVKNMKSTADARKRRIVVFVREVGATHSLQQRVLEHDVSSSILSSNSDERHGRPIPKSNEFLAASSEI